MDETSQPKAMTIGDLAGICWRRRWTMLTLGMTAAVLTLLICWQIRPMYQAKAAITVSQLVVGQDDGRTATQIADYRFINTEAERLISSPILRTVLEQTGAIEEEPYASSSDPAWILRTRSNLQTDRNSLVIGVSVEDETPLRAERLLSGIIDVYREQQNGSELDRDPQALQVLDEQITQLQASLDLTQAEAARIRRDNGIISADPDNNHLTARLGELGRSLLDREQQLSVHDAVVRQVEASSAEQDPERRLDSLLQIDRILNQPRVATALAELEQAEDEAAALADQLLPKHPALQRSQRLVVDARNRLEQAVERAIGGMDQERERMVAAIATERAQVAELNQELNQYRDAVATLTRLANRTASTENLLAGLRMREAELSIASSPVLTRSAVTEPPHALPDPVNIKPKLFFALALFVGMVIGALGALIHELIDPRVRHLELLETELGLRTVGYIPIARRMPIGEQLVDPRNHPPALREAFRVLRSNLLLFDRQQAESKVILCTSVGPGDGKSTIATHLALSLAAIGRNVLLLEGDLRRPGLHRLFGMNPQAGLHEVIDERIAEDMAIQVAPNLRLLASGHAADLSEEPLHDPHLRQYYLKAARRRYDHIIIDSPPIGEIADAYAFLDQATTILAVARYQHTNRQRLRRTLEGLLATVECPVRLVLNGCPRRELRSDSYRPQVTPHLDPVQPTAGRPQIAARDATPAAT